MKILFIGLFFIFTGVVGEGQVTAQDGKTYKTVKIGAQTWMAENLDVSTYRNGDTIPQVQDAKEWSNLKTGAWCYYEGKPESGNGYGKIYNWYAVNDPRGLAPEGWHIPSDAEWSKLATFLGGNLGTSGKIKSVKGWIKAGNGTNETGFNAIPAGTRSIELFLFAGRYGYWWTSTEFDSYSAWNRFLSYNNDDIGRSTGWKQFGNAVRCIKDEGESDSRVFLPPTKKKDIISASQDSSKIEELVTHDYKPDLVRIGDQTWTSSNLDVGQFRNGEIIPEAKTDSEWVRAARSKQPAWCYYENDTTNKKYGKLYNWYAINDKRGLAPEGWHVGSEDEWGKLVNELGEYRTAGEKIKSSETGFNGLFGGFRDSDGQFHSMSTVGYWWSSTETRSGAWCYSINYFSDALNNDNSCDKGKGFSIRCIRDQ